MRARMNEATIANLDKDIVESFGSCTNWKRCRNFQVILGNGLCMKCWDKGVYSRMPKIELSSSWYNKKNSDE